MEGNQKTKYAIAMEEKNGESVSFSKPCDCNGQVIQFSISIRSRSNFKERQTDQCYCQEFKLFKIYIYIYLHKNIF